MIDDFHNINVVKTPQGRQLSNAVHMATILVDLQNHIPVKVSANAHRNVKIKAPGKEEQNCKGGISGDAVAKEFEDFWHQYCNKSFLESVPENYRRINPGLLQKSLRELRYTHNTRTMCICINN